MNEKQHIRKRQDNNTESHTLSTDKFDPEDVGIANGNYFGFPFSEENAELLLLSVPWDVTSSYGDGAAFGPDAIIEASTQLDFYDPMSPGEWRRGIATLPIEYSIQDRSQRLRPDARKIMEILEEGGISTDDYPMPRRLERINTASAELNREVYDAAADHLAAGRIVGLVGGDHSTPLGLIRAVAEQHPGVGILHLDAHCDLRKAYEGFDYSHASIMYNVLNEVEGVATIVQVGQRDYSQTELMTVRTSPKIQFVEDYELCRRKFAGESWDAICDSIVALLPQKVYISFDIDVLSPEFCPSTGTPVPGGLSFNEAVWLLDRIAASGRRIVGFDLCEVASSQNSNIDAIVGARVLFKMCGITLKSNQPK